jgi:pimeloyl-ACP methyl ester carboxylesterase
LLILFVLTRLGAARIARENPPVGAVIEANGTKLHYVHVPAGPDADLPPLVFLHGASANLNDQMIPFRPLLDGRAEMLFFDRPGHGWSERGKDNSTQGLQAETLTALMDALEIKDAIIVAHSFGSSVAMGLVLAHPERVRGIVFLAPATHPWPNKKTQWYYDVASIPVLGRIFTETLTLPVGQMSIAQASLNVFCPNPPPEGYTTKAQIPLVLRPSAFHANAQDVAGLHDYVTEASKRYGEIKKPVVIITGDEDTVVAEEIHSKGLERDVPGSELLWIKGLGHKPDYAATQLAVSAIEKINGKPHDLQVEARALEVSVAESRVTGCE